MSDDAHLIYEFSGRRLDPARRQLTHGGKPVAMFPRCFDALLLLVERRGALLEKDFLLQALWPDVVVDENSLAKVISEIRRTLGEGPRDPGSIVTVPRRGYRFVADVGVHRVPGGKPAASDWPERRDPRPRRPAVFVPEPVARRRDPVHRSRGRTHHAARTTAPHDAAAHFIDRALRRQGAGTGGGRSRTGCGRRHRGKSAARGEHDSRQRAAGVGRRGCGVVGGKFRYPVERRARTRGFHLRACRHRAHLGPGAR